MVMDWTLMFEVNEPDSDGEMGADASLTWVNETSADIRLVRSRAVYFNAAGAGVGACDDETSTRVEPGESITIGISPRWPSLNVGSCGDSRDDILCRVTSVFLRREVLSLGEVPLPASHDACASVCKEMKTTSVAPRVHAIVTRDKPSDDGEVSVNVRSGISNTSAKRIDAVTLKAELLDADGLIVETSESTINLVDAGADAALEASFWGIKKGILSGARARIYVILFHREAFLACEGTSTPA